MKLFRKRKIEMPPLKFLVIGCGSIGERHIRNLLDLGVTVIVCDRDLKRLSDIEKKYYVPTFADITQAFLQLPIDATIICTPPTSHIHLALESIDRGLHTFIEKPLSDKVDQIDKLIKKAEKKNLIILIGYNLRYHQGLNLVKRMIDKGKIGKILSIAIEAGQYLPDWRPHQDYSQSYTAREELGGGIILDGSHEIDYAYWLMGEVCKISCFADKLSDLNVNVEDTAEILLRFKNNSIARIHLDFIQRGYARSCKVIGEKGTITLDYPTKIVKLYLPKKNKIYSIKDDISITYIKEMQHFIRCICEKETPLVTIAEGKEVLKIALAAKKASRMGRVISL